MRSETLIVVSYDSKSVSSSLKKYFHEYSSRVIVHRVAIDVEILLIPEMLRYVLRIR